MEPAIRAGAAGALVGDLSSAWQESGATRRFPHWHAYGPGAHARGMTTIALIVIDVQQGFDDSSWGEPNNPAALDNVARLVSAWQEAGQPIVLVRHDSKEDGSPLRPDGAGNALEPFLDAVEPALFVTKSVNSAFHGDADLHAWLLEQHVDAIVLAGIQTNMCVETTARVGGNLGHRVSVALDATRTFALTGPDGTTLTADELARATATNLHGGGFARIVSTDDTLADLTPR